ncbi:GreA/GreB family elongation factor [soil metagenome]
MTSTASPSRTEVLTTRLATLREEHDQLVAANIREASGDVADRATDVETSIRLQLLEERIATLELEIADARTDHHVDGVVSVGDSVVLDFGDGPESFVVGSVEQAAAGIDTVTPSSPLGQAIIGAAVGTTVTYSPRSGLSLQATIVSAS